MLLDIGTEPCIKGQGGLQGGVYYCLTVGLFDTLAWNSIVHSLLAGSNVVVLLSGTLEIMMCPRSIVCASEVVSAAARATRMTWAGHHQHCVDNPAGAGRRSRSLSLPRRKKRGAVALKPMVM